MTTASGFVWLGGILLDSRTIVVATLHLAVASAVTAHVLLRKSDVGSATGWIGLAWLSPFLGGALYYLLGVNRVRLRARKERDGLPRGADNTPVLDDERDDGFAPLDRAAAAITGRRATRGNSVGALRNGDEAYPRMLAAIDAAQSSVALSSYILRDDSAGEAFIDALTRAHTRHVQVRVLIDGIGGGYFTSKAYRRLRRDGVPAARFMHSILPWRMPFLNLRTHKKVLVVDGRKAFTGGLNIGAENILALHPRNPVRDLHFGIDGPVVAQLAEAFANDWLSAAGETLSGPVWFPTLAETGSQTARVVTAGPDQDIEKIEFVALMAITCARKSVTVMTPYFLPDGKLVSALCLAGLRGVAVDIIIPARSNHRSLDLAAQANIEPLLRSGCRIWKNPPPFEHSKLMIVDGAWAFIGSSNWDMRSLRLNFELNVEVYDAGLAQDLEIVALSKRGEAVSADELALRPVAAKLRDAAIRLLLPYL